MSVDLSNHARIYAPEYGSSGFSDHYPMALTALRGLRANDEQVNAFASAYVKNLRRCKVTKETIDSTHLSARFGDASVYPAALNYFHDAIERDGRVAILRERLPELTDSITSAAFHGVIRTAYGLIANESMEIAAGLAYWWANAEPIAPGGSIGAANANAQSLIDDLAEQVNKERKALQLDQPTISARINAVARHPALSAILNRAAATDMAFEEIANVALRLYLSEPNLTTLHCVTGAHAARLIGEHVVMSDAGLRKALWVGVCAIYAAAGAPELTSLKPPPAGAPDWLIIASAACGSLDAHDIKFVYSCLEESRKFGGDAAYRYAAAHRLEILGP